MPKVPAYEAVTDPVVAFEEEPRDSEVDSESPAGMISFFFFNVFLHHHLLTYIYFLFLAS